MGGTRRDSRHPHQGAHSAAGASPPAPQPADLLTSRQVARYLGVSEATLSRWRQQAIGPSWIDLAGIARYRLQDLESHVQERRR